MAFKKIKFSETFKLWNTEKGQAVLLLWSSGSVFTNYSSFITSLILENVDAD